MPDGRRNTTGEEAEQVLRIQEVPTGEIAHWYPALQTDFDERELLSRRAIQKAVKRGEQEFLLFVDEYTGIPQGYALCCIRNVYGYVLLKYFGILSWFRGKGVGVEAMRLLNRRYAEKQGILAELTVFDDDENGEYLRKLKRFFTRFGYEEVPCNIRIGGAKVILTAKPLKGTAEIAPVARRILADFYSRCLRPAEMEKMLR